MSTQKQFTLPELLAERDALLAWANIEQSTNPQTIALRDQCKAALAKGAQS